MAKLPDPTGHLDSEGREIFQKLSGPRGGLSGMYLSLMNHPELAEKIGVLGTFLRFGGTLPGDVREIVILMSARIMGSGYEWLKHTGPADKEGVPPEMIEAIRQQDFEAAALTDRNRTLHELVACVLAGRDLPTALQDKVEGLFGTKGLIELVVLIGFYRMINTVIVSFDVALPDAAEPPF